MKKRIIILSTILLILIIILAILLILHNTQSNNSIISEENGETYSTITGTIDDIYLNKIYIIPDDEDLKNLYEKISFEIPEDTDRTWSIGDIVKVTYIDGNISEKGIIESQKLEYLGKTRVFKENITVPVSNSTYPAGTTIFKSFNIYKENIDLEDFILQDELYMKKVDSYNDYLKYKEQFEELRELTEDDFVNYYLVIVISEDNTSTLTFNKTESNNAYLNLHVLQSDSLVDEDNKPYYTGLAIIIPNNTDYSESNIQVIKNINEVKISEENAFEIAKQALKDDNITEWTDYKISTQIANLYYLQQKDDANTDYEHKYDPITQYKFVRIIQVDFQDAGSVGCYVGVSINATTGEILCYHWSGE